MACGINWLLRAAGGNDAGAMLLLSQLPDAGAWQPSALERRRWRDRAARLGCAEAQWLVGEECWAEWLVYAESVYYGGSPACRARWELAWRWLRRAASSGSRAGALRLAAMCCHPQAPPGCGGPRLSYGWLLRATSHARAAGGGAEAESEADLLQTLHYLQGPTIPRPLVALPRLAIGPTRRS